MVIALAAQVRLRAAEKTLAGHGPARPGIISNRYEGCVGVGTGARGRACECNTEHPPRPPGRTAGIGIVKEEDGRF